MNNQLIIEQNWWKRNWKWFLPTLLFSILVGLFLALSIDGNATDIAQAYSDNSLYEKAIEKARSNERVLEIIGDIKPIDKLAFIEGDAIYSNNNSSVALSLRIEGSKRKGKIDIIADKNGTKWEYKKINIRIKNPKEEIQILKDSIEVH